MDNQDDTSNEEQHEEILEEDISKALEKRLGTNNFVILRTQLDLLKKVGLLGEHYILTIDYLNEEGHELSSRFFVKFFPKLKKQQDFADGIGAFKKEMFVYDLFDKFRNNENDLVSNVAPKCYFARYNRYLILDNIADEGFQPLNKLETFDYDTVLTTLQSLARFHAASIIYEEKVLGKTLLEVYEEDLEESFFSDREGFVGEVFIAASVVGIKNEIELFKFDSKLKCGKDFATTAEKLCNKIYDLVKPSKEFRNVLSHGDLWATNFLVKFSPKTNAPIGCKFVDFQASRYVPPSHDVLSFLYLNTTRSFREKYMYQLIGMYYSYLEKHLKFCGLDPTQLLPFSEFLESCEEQKIFAVVQTAFHLPLVLIDDDSIYKYFEDDNLYDKAIGQDRSLLVVWHMNKDEKYKNRILDSIRDIKDCCECL